MEHTPTRSCRRQRPLVCTCTRNAGKSGRAKGDHSEDEKVAATPCKREKEVEDICFISANHCRQMGTTKAIGVRDSFWFLLTLTPVHMRCRFQFPSPPSQSPLLSLSFSFSGFSVSDHFAPTQNGLESEQIELHTGSFHQVLVFCMTQY